MAEKPKAKSDGGSKGEAKRPLRSRLWFDNPDNPGMTALYIERYLNFGLTPAELQIGQADHRHRPDRLRSLALQPASSRSREAGARRDHRGGRRSVRVPGPSDPGDRQAADGGARPQPRLSRPRRDPDGLFHRRRRAHDRLRQDHARPASWPRRRSNIPAIVLSGGPMNNGWHHGERTGSGTIVWQARSDLAEGKIDYEEFMEIVTSSAPSIGHCNTMGTASTMNALAEALGMSLPGCAAIPAPHRERGQIAYDTGQAHRRHGVGGPEAVRHPDARGVRERHRGQQRDRRLDQRADPRQRHRPPHRRQARHRRLGESRPSRPAAGQHAAGRASTSARSSIARAACRRSCTN